jgi:hypothetical protein
MKPMTTPKVAEPFLLGSNCSFGGKREKYCSTEA